MYAYALNLLDLALTLYALQHGGVELNPLMRSIPVMVAWKTVGVGVGCWFLNKQTKSANKQTALLAYRGLRVCAAAYAAVCFHHLIFIFGGAF